MSCHALCVPKLRDERLCWLAVEDSLRRRSRRMGPLGWLAVLGSAGLYLFAGRSRPAARMRAYSVAVDHVAGFLDDAERATLRDSGSVPPWFVHEVHRVDAGKRDQRREQKEEIPCEVPARGFFRPAKFSALKRCAMVCRVAICALRGGTGLRLRETLLD